jgi:hypothetical protein
VVVVAPAGPDASGELSCRETIDAFCATAASCIDDCPCVPDWPTAKNEARGRCTGGGWDRVFVYPQCDGYNLIVIGYTDTSTFHYYDPVTLKLVRVEDHGIGGSTCVAGQPGPVVPLTDCLDGASPISICDVDASGD